MEAEVEVLEAKINRLLAQKQVLEDAAAHIDAFDNKQQMLKSFYEVRSNQYLGQTHKRQVVVTFFPLLLQSKGGKSQSRNARRSPHPCKAYDFQIGCTRFELD